MRFSAYATVCVLALCSVVLGGELKTTQVGIKKRAEKCELRASKGDTLSMHYTGTLEDGTKFDSSRDRGQPFTFTLGVGQVIIGWDKGVMGICVGEQRKLRIPAHEGYGDRGSPPTIPGGATLVFDIECMDIKKAGAGGHGDEF